MDGIFCHAAERLAVDLQWPRLVKTHRDLMAVQNVHALCMAHVSSGKDGRENRQRSELAAALHDHHGHCSVLAQPVLRRRGHHAAAIKTAVHRRREPDLSEFMPHTVNRDHRVCRFVMKQQALDRNGRVIDLFSACIAQRVAFFTAVAVNAVSDAVQKAVCMAASLHERELFPIEVDADRLRPLFQTEVTQKIVPASDGVIIDRIGEHRLRRVVQKAIERAVTACEDHLCRRPDAVEKIRIAFNGGDVPEFQFLCADGAQLHRRVPSGSAARLWIVKHICFHVALSFCHVLSRLRR